MTDIGREIDKLDAEAGSLIDDLFENDNAAPPGDMIAPMVELSDPDRGVTNGSPARGGMEFDLNLVGEQQEERAAGEVDAVVGRDDDDTALQTRAADLLAVGSLDDMDRSVGDLGAFEGVLETYEQDP
jgi:hypothetical protein